jgi:hypothetical protein
VQYIRNIWPLRISRTVLMLSGAVELVLVAIGVYDVTPYVAGQRCSALGIRLALGATPENFRAFVVRRAVLTGVSGLAIGAASEELKRHGAM